MKEIRDRQVCVSTRPCRPGSDISRGAVGVLGGEGQYYREHNKTVHMLGTVQITHGE